MVIQLEFCNKNQNATFKACCLFYLGIIYGSIQNPTKNQLSLDEIPGSEAWKLGHGGKRAGSGRKKSAVETKVIRVPMEVVSEVESMIEIYKNNLDS
jgi:hypothetical protein|tara:strand:- start:275 stop:565 length:291 start_codon:yes stop_codon:yes gene_type:complete